MKENEKLVVVGVVIVALVLFLALFPMYREPNYGDSRYDGGYGSGIH